MKNINVLINNKKYKGKSGETILELAKRNNINIPTLCNDERLEPYSSCYLCVVEIDGVKNLQTSCSTRILDGMKIFTNNERIKKSRKAALDLLLSNHYADCVAPCKETCPAGVDVQGYISLIEKSLYKEAIALIKEVNPLPAICGRVCVRPCEVACRRNLADNSPTGIDYMKRFIADYDLQSEDYFIPEIEKSTNKKIAVIGAGPGGLSCAYFLQQKGHQVDIFEANSHAGGMLRYGIPEYRLPNDILDKEVERIKEIGVKIFFNKKLGKNINFEEIKKNYDATILTIGSQKGTLVGCEGDDATNVFSGIDFLGNMEMTGKPMDFSNKTVAVVGGGNTAMDCCRTAMRCGAEKVFVIYRRTEKEMPANPIEIHESKLEGIEYLFLTNPSKVNKDENGILKSVTCIKMELGEPDKSGRRRPVPIKNSEFELKLDFILAAIGQKTVVDFLDNVNEHFENEQLKINRWGDIDANVKTLQTGVSSIFAAGDGVTGPATLIEAIAQAKIASLSCHQFLMNEEIKAVEKEFLSKKDNFKKQVSEDYFGKFESFTKNEMPTLDKNNRVNFKEVELGFDERTCQNEANRCLECGCESYFTCDLKKYATEYNADQKRFAGDFKEYEIDNSHPFIEIDNNKCILCAKCVRICRDVVGANALGLVKRGFDTFIAPSMENSLIETNCESCGMCISVCPTAAIIENINFKISPIKMDSFETISNYGSIGEKIKVHYKNDFVFKVTGEKGLINKDGNIGKFDKFGYDFYNSSQRITKPLQKVNGEFKEISFEKAYQIIKEKINQVKPDENMFFAGARLTNEEIYLIQKFARVGVKTNNISNFHYLNRGDYKLNTLANTPFEEIKQASKIYVLGAELSQDYQTVGFMVHNAKVQNEIAVDLITTKEDSKMLHKVDNILNVKSYYHFIKAVNYYFIENNLQNQFFIDGNCQNFAYYKEKLLAENFDNLVNLSGLDKKQIIDFANAYNREMNAIIIFSEKEVSSNASKELFNLAIISGKLGKTASGLISLKEKNNAQGLFDMGAFTDFSVGCQSVFDKMFTEQSKKVWEVEHLPKKIIKDQCKLLADGEIKNTFIFGEDPISCAVNKDAVKDVFSKMDFIVVQDYFLTETALVSDLVLPASFPAETGGSFTNTQKVIQTFEKALSSKLEKTNPEQLIDLLKIFGNEQINDLSDVMMEVIGLLPNYTQNNKFFFQHTKEDNFNKRFNYACDILVKNFETVLS